MTKNNESNNPPDINWEWVIVLLLILYYWINDVFKKVFFKHKVISEYKVNKKTFAKWVKHFCDDKILPYANYVKSKKLTNGQIAHIYAQFGNPQEPTMSKANIIEITEGSYRTLRECIRKSPDKFGITPTAFEELNCFPPAIANRIINAYS